ncbi:tRNA (guanosine(46)-N7)-methyltransferase TrmB [Mycoplasmopsis gallinacea]|uniref:tRNA (guanine-N(7)-)-methyltransferase n=1 Tax=Mycoplasmopsis gallinacea TaxID=29556 RepID=A0A449A3T4_9BACT|nr:tRNA (guanosine(46)-N7)-methyltransferase TrmB [Mycoplasmopsis gallinacea]VEU58833.1 tRNA (guanine-N(7)-)-methyltransferase [Mycoplasmopsis gallinacea]
MRLRHDKTAADKLAQSKFLIKNFPLKVNENDILEIGAGKGEMITQLALNNPNITYYALEKYPTVANKILKKINELNLENLFIITEDATKIDELFDGTMNQIWLTFSDPWPKNAHEKRRLTYKTFLEKYRKIMNPNSVLKFKTDNDKLFNYSVESFKENNWTIIDLTTDLHKSKYNADNYQTGYEQKWSALGKNINFLIAKPN